MTAALEAFLAGAGWAGAERALLAEDASFRRYHRIRLGGRSAVCMEADPGRENVPAFLEIARLLGALGLSAPGILAADPGAGFALLEDLGDRTFSRLLDAGADPAPLYALATDLLIDLHRRFDPGPAPPAPYSDRLFLDEARLLVDWYLPAATGAPADGAAAAAYDDIWGELLARARGVPETLVLRDFHVDNLMELEARAGVARCGLLDFQDAVIGPVSYDFVSLTEDARRDVRPDIAAAMRRRYLDAFPGLDAGAFDRSCRILGAQRHCKVLGIFTRLRDRDGKPGYLVHVPRLWRLLEAALADPELAPLRHWLDEQIPPGLRIAPPARGAE